MAQVLIIEDEETLRSSMVRGLARVPGLRVDDAATLAGGTEVDRPLRS